MIYSGGENSSCVGNECYSGYSIDLLLHLAQHMNFYYELYTVPDGKYGSLDEGTHTWNGLVAELIPDPTTGLTVSAINYNY